MILNPKTQTYDYLDPASRDLMLKTIAFEAINKEIATLTNPRKADEGMAMMILEKAW